MRTQTPRWTINLLWILAACCCAAQAEPVPEPGNISVSDPWIRATVPGQTSSGAFVKLQARQEATLLAVESPIAEAAIHEMSTRNGIMRMREVKQLVLPANQMLELAPRGYHIMLTNLRQPLRVGSKVPLTLKFNIAGKSQKMQIEAEVRALNYAPAQDANTLHGQHQHAH